MHEASSSEPRKIGWEMYVSRGERALTCRTDISSESAPSMPSKPDVSTMPSMTEECDHIDMCGDDAIKPYGDRRMCSICGRWWPDPHIVILGDEQNLSGRSR